MQRVIRRTQIWQASVSTASRLAVPAVAMMFALASPAESFAAEAVSAPPEAAVPEAAPPEASPVAHTAWADAVRSHFAALTSHDSADSATTTAAANPHAVTAWARAVEARLAARAHRMALAGRTALAWSESGVASWYGRHDHSGRMTSSGERFDPMKLTCAHPTLPLGTKLLVTSESTGRSVVVTVNDRGPFSGRIVDLSPAAAARIGMLNSGTASVTLQQATPEVVEVAAAAEGDTSEQALTAADVSQSTHGRPQTTLADR